MAPRVRLSTRTLGPLAWLFLTSLILGACGSAMPKQASSAALHRDLERLVELADTEGWSVDRIEVEEALPAALESVCRTTEATRRDLLSWLEAQIAREGGDIRTVYRARGSDLGAVSELLTLSRVRLLLNRSIEVASQDCPFWLEPKSTFDGRQILDNRWFLSLGGGGKGTIERQAGETDVHFGGAGRLMLGRGFGRHATILAGIEAGGSAAFPKDEEGERGDLDVTANIVTPLVYRHRRVNSYWEVEAGYVARTREQDLDVSHGFRLGVALGGSASRRRWLFPGAAFGIAYERIAEEQTLHFIKLGFRVALDIAR